MSPSPSRSSSSISSGTLSPSSDSHDVIARPIPSVALRAWEQQWEELSDSERDDWLQRKLKERTRGSLPALSDDDPAPMTGPRRLSSDPTASDDLFRTPPPLLSAVSLPLLGSQLTASSLSQATPRSDEESSVTVAVHVVPAAVVQPSLDRFEADQLRYRRSTGLFTEALRLLIGLGKKLQTATLPAYAEAAETAIAQLSLPPSNRVLIIGDTAAGKSTFINALLSVPLLSSREIRSTGLVCEVAWGEKPALLLQFSASDAFDSNFNGVAEINAKLARYWEALTAGSELPQDCEPRFVLEQFLLQKRPASNLYSYFAATTSQEEEPLLPVQRVRIEWPSRLLQHGLVLVDTPGLHESAALTELVVKEAKASVAFICVLDKVFSGTMSDCWEQLQQKTKCRTNEHRVFFVCSKLDLLSNLPVRRETLADVVVDLSGRFAMWNPDHFAIFNPREALKVQLAAREHQVKGTSCFTPEHCVMLEKLTRFFSWLMAMQMEAHLRQGERYYQLLDDLHTTQAVLVGKSQIDVQQLWSSLQTIRLEYDLSRKATEEEMLQQCKRWPKTAVENLMSAIRASGRSTFLHRVWKHIDAESMHLANNPSRPQPSEPDRRVWFEFGKKPVQRAIREAISQQLYDYVQDFRKQFQEKFDLHLLEALNKVDQEEKKLRSNGLFVLTSTMPPTQSLACPSPLSNSSSASSSANVVVERLSAVFHESEIPILDTSLLQNDGVTLYLRSFIHTFTKGFQMPNKAAPPPPAELTIAQIHDMPTLEHFLTLFSTWYVRWLASYADLNSLLEVAVERSLLENPFNPKSVYDQLAAAWQKNERLQRRLRLSSLASTQADTAIAWSDEWRAILRDTRKALNKSSVLLTSRLFISEQELQIFQGELGRGRFAVVHPAQLRIAGSDAWITQCSPSLTPPPNISSLAQLQRPSSLALTATVAVKKMAFDGGDPGLMIFHEADLLGHLRHNNIVHTHGTFVNDDVTEVRMVEARSHHTLQQALDQGLFKPGLSHDKAAARIHSVLLGVASAMCYVHLQRVVHRDLKPSNILMQCGCSLSMPENPALSTGLCEHLEGLDSFKVMVADFGSSKYYLASRSNSNELTAPFPYSASELARALQEAQRAPAAERRAAAARLANADAGRSIRSLPRAAYALLEAQDVFSFAMIAYQLCHGLSTAHLEQEVSTAVKIWREDLSQGKGTETELLYVGARPWCDSKLLSTLSVCCRKLIQQEPFELEALIRRCWAVDPRSRPSFHELVLLLWRRPSVISHSITEPALSRRRSSQPPHSRQWVLLSHDTGGSRLVVQAAVHCAIEAALAPYVEAYKHRFDAQCQLMHAGAGIGALAATARAHCQLSSKELLSLCYDFLDKQGELHKHGFYYSVHSSRVLHSICKLQNPHSAQLLQPEKEYKKLLEAKMKAMAAAADGGSSLDSFLTGGQLVLLEALNMEEGSISNSNSNANPAMPLRMPFLLRSYDGPEDDPFGHRGATADVWKALRESLAADNYMPLAPRAHQTECLWDVAFHFDMVSPTAQTMDEIGQIAARSWLPADSKAADGKPTAEQVLPQALRCVVSVGTGMCESYLLPGDSLLRALFADNELVCHALSADEAHTKVKHECAALGIPYFRFDPSVPSSMPLDVCHEEELDELVRCTNSYMSQGDGRRQLDELVRLLTQQLPQLPQQAAVNDQPVAQRSEKDEA